MLMLTYNAHRKPQMCTICKPCGDTHGMHAVDRSLPLHSCAPALLLAAVATHSNSMANRRGPHSLCHATCEPAYRCLRCRSWTQWPPATFWTTSASRRHAAAPSRCSVCLLRWKRRLRALRSWSPWSPSHRRWPRRSSVAARLAHPASAGLVVQGHARHTVRTFWLRRALSSSARRSL